MPNAATATAEPVPQTEEGKPPADDKPQAERCKPGLSAKEGGTLATHPKLPGYAAEWVFVTPKMAKWFLELNWHNRKEKPQHEATMTRDIKNGDWEVNGATMVFDQEGLTRDGQNRCRAIIEAGKGAWTLIVWGITEKAVKTIDSNVARTARDVLAMAQAPNVTVATSLAKRLFLWTAGERASLANVKPSIAEQAATYAENATKIQQAITYASWARRTGEGLSRVSLTVWGTMWLVFGVVADDQEVSQFFLDRVVEGYGLEKGAPEAALRRWLSRAADTNRKVNEAEVTYAFIRAWNAWRSNEQLDRIQLPQKVTAKSYPEPF